jgi:hypothetical protein
MKRLAAIVIVLILVAAWREPVQASGNGITVSIPPAPIRAAPGETMRIPFRVSNNDRERAVQFSIVQRALSLGDDGRIDVLPDPDPAFATLNLPTDEQTLDPGAYRDYTFDLTVPVLAPDMYLVGFLISIHNELVGDVNVQGRVATFATLDVPGVRDRRLHAELHLPGFRLGTSASGQVVLSNIGGASFSTWGEIDTGGSPPDRIPKTFLAAGHQRSIGVSTSTKWGIGRKQVSISVYHNITDSQTGVDKVTATVWFVHPAYIAEGATLLLAGALACIEWLRRRRARSLRFHPIPLPVEHQKRSDAA